MDRQAQFLQAEDNYCQLLNGLMTEMDGVNTDFLGLLQAVYSELARFIEQIVVRGQKAKQIHRRRAKPYRFGHSWDSARSERRKNQSPNVLASTSSP